MSTTITTSIYIQATAKDVWTALTQFEAYNRWNPFIKEISGVLVKGQKLNVTIDNMSFKPTILNVEMNTSLEWIGHLIMPNIFDGKHMFQIIKHENGLMFKQSECFSGILVPLFKKKIKGDILHQFNAMNKALKQYVEQGHLQ